MTNQQSSPRKPVNQFKIKAYRLLKNAEEKIQLIGFLNRKSSRASENLYHVGIPNSTLDIVTIAYNHPHMTALQIQLLKKNIQDPFTHIVADNSSESAQAQKIFDACIEHGAEYVRVPSNPFTRNKSHAAAMHWVYKNVLTKRKRKVIGFLDHDIFPTRPCSIITSMQQGIYGRPMNAYNHMGEWVPITPDFPYWSLWAGLYFIESSLLEKTNVYALSFFQKFLSRGRYLDTGGRLWDSVLKYKNYPADLMNYQCLQFRETSDSNIHTDFYEQYDNWIHIVNLSNWYNTPNFEEKIAYFEKLLFSELNQ